MRTRALLVCLLVVAAGLPAPVSGQTSSTVDLDITFTLSPDDGTVHVAFQVQDPGRLETLQLRLGDLESMQGSATLEGSWEEEDGVAIAQLDESPNARAEWTSNGRIRAQTLEGRGNTSWVGGEFAVVKAGDMVPGIRYTYRGEAPSFDTELDVRTPETWSVKGPWPKGQGAFQLDRPLPRGFLAAGPDLEEGRLGQDEDAYRLVRVAGAREDETTERILLEARSFLGGVYGRTAHERFIVVAPDPMFRGGLGSPAGVFLHDKADSNVVAHEMVHAYQGFRFSRSPGEATVWLAEGTAVAHSVLLEVAAGVKSREDARDFLQKRHEQAEEDHAVALTSAVYGSGNEQAAYAKGSVVVTALDDRIREDTANQYTLSDVLKDLNRRGQASDSFEVKTSQLLSIIEEVTGADAGPFFDDYVYGADVPPLGSIFPDAVSIRILGTEPDSPVAGEAFQVEAKVTNLDTRESSIDRPVEIDGEERGRLTATLEAGGSARTWAAIQALEKGTYEVRIEGASLRIEVVLPAEPTVNVTYWPPQPTSDGNVSVGARIANTGEAPYREPVSIELDGDVVLEREVDVAAGQARTISTTVGSLLGGLHEVRVFAGGEELASRSFTVQQPPRNDAVAPSGLVLVSLVGLALLLSRARARR